MDLEDIDFIELLDSLPDSFPDTAIKLDPPAEFIAELAHDLRNISVSLSDEDFEYHTVEVATAFYSRFIDKTWSH